MGVLKEETSGSTINAGDLDPLRMNQGEREEGEGGGLEVLMPLINCCCTL